jgi:chaperonin GroES
MKLKPLDDRVVVKPLQAEEKTAGGIVLPDTAKEKPQVGKIVAVGEGKILENGKRGKMSVKKNDQVLFGKYSGSDVEIDGEEYKIMRESEILGIVEK